MHIQHGIAHRWVSAVAGRQVHNDMPLLDQIPGSDTEVESETPRITVSIAWKRRKGSSRARRRAFQHVSML
jgi:hypothetical protein